MNSVSLGKRLDELAQFARDAAVNNGLLRDGPGQHNGDFRYIVRLAMEQAVVDVLVALQADQVSPLEKFGFEVGTRGERNPFDD